MVALAEGEQGHGGRIAGAVRSRIGPTADHVAKRVDAEGALLDDHRTEEAGDEEGGQSRHPRRLVTVEITPSPAQEGRCHEPNDETNPLDVAVLPHHEGVCFEVLHIGDGGLWLQAEEQPADMGVEEALGDVVRILILVDVLVVDAVVGGPVQGGVLEGSGAKQQDEDLHGPLGLEGQVGEEAVVAQGDAKTGGVVVEDEQGPDEGPTLHLARSAGFQVILGPQEPRHHRQRQQGRADQENGRDPLDAVDRKIPKLHTNRDCGADSAEASGIESAENPLFGLLNYEAAGKKRQKRRFSDYRPHKRTDFQIIPRDRAGDRANSSRRRCAPVRASSPRRSFPSGA